jgi:hypothetical protein
MLTLAAMGVISPSYEQLCGNILEFLFFNSHHLVLLGFNNVQPLVMRLLCIDQDSERFKAPQVEIDFCLEIGELYG